MPDGGRVAVCYPESLEDLQHWVGTDRRTARRLLELVRATLRDPLEWLARHEPAKCLGPDVWSHCTAREHRCVHLVRGDRVEFLQGRHHY